MRFCEDDSEYEDLQNYTFLKSFHTDTESSYLNFQDYEIS
jgi:hypothetical protein